MRSADHILRLYRSNMLNFDVNSLHTPCYITDEMLLKKNLEILADIRKKTGAKILLAQKCFSMFSCYPLIAEYLDGVTASGLYEAKLGFEEMKKPFGRENHVFSPAYDPEDMPELLEICDHFVFNSFKQYSRFKPMIEASGKRPEVGIRINPEYSEMETPIYDPCAPFSRLGTTLANFDPDMASGLDGLHFHTLCEQGADALAHTLVHVEEKFGRYLSKMKWLNFGGGHHITKDNYDVGLLISEIDRIQQKYGVQVYLEPGEAVALNAGFLVSTVLETSENGMNIAILDASAACHMPDVLEMPYRPMIIGSGEANEKPFTYRLGAATCLSGDVIGDYSFDKPLEVGDKLVFCDMAIYTMVKNNTFNGMKLPDILLCRLNGDIETVRHFGYEDFKCRL